MATTTTGFLDLLDPTADVETTNYPLAKRVDSLDGKVFGLLDNGKSNFNNLLSDFEEIIKEKFPSSTVIRRRKPTVAAAVPPDTMKELLEKCDVIVTGLGD